jgi:hypothetical protein
MQRLKRGRILDHLEGGEPDAQAPFAPRPPPQRELPLVNPL